MRASIVTPPLIQFSSTIPAAMSYLWLSQLPKDCTPWALRKNPTPAGLSPGPTADQRKDIHSDGDQNGCHTCGTSDPGTKSGNWVGDHQPPTALNPPGGAQNYYPQCLACSRRQGGLIRGLRY